MFDMDLLITFVLMGLIFLRQIAIFKQPGKINYAPILLGIGAIGAMVHLLLNPEYEDFYLLFRQALLPLFLGLVLFIFMNIMHQTVLRGENQHRIEVLERFILEMAHIKKNIEASDVRLQSLSATERDIKQILDRFSHIDFTSLKNIEENQHTFFQKFETIFEQQQAVLKTFETFTNEKMPDIDAVIHRHIDLLRIAEQDHYNHVQKGMAALMANHNELTERIATLKLDTPAPLINDVKLKEVVLKIDTLMQQIVNDFDRQMVSLRAQSEGLSTAIAESDSAMQSIREQEELLMSELLVSTKHVKEMHDSSGSLGDIYAPLLELTERVATISGDYSAAQRRLDVLAEALQSVEEVQIEKMREHIETLSDTLTQKIDESLENLHQHYNIAHKDISKTVQELSTKAKMARSYQSEDHSS